MTVESLADLVIDAGERRQAVHVVTGAFADNDSGLPRATTDVDVVAEVQEPTTI